MFLLKAIPFAIAVVFLFMSPRYAAGTACLAVGAASLMWWLEPRERWRAVAWGALLAGAAVLWFKGGAAFALAVGIPVTVLIAFEFLGRKEPEGDPPRVWLLVAAIVLAVCGAALSRYTGAPRALGEVSRIVVIGDSLSSGVPGDGVARLWPDILAGHLRAEVVNLSYPGDMVSHAHNRWRPTIERRAWRTGSPGWEPDLVILEIGGNDIRQRVSPAALERDLRTLVQDLLPTGAKILIVAVPGALMNDPYRNLWGNIADSHDQVEMMSQSTLRSIFGSQRYTLPDRIHFSQEGHEFFAQRVAARIRGETD